MRTYSNLVTARLESLAQYLGVECEIKVAEAQEDARYFVISIDDEPLKEPVPLGFTDEEAAFALKTGRWQRYVLRGAPTRLTPRRVTKSKAQRARRRLSGSF